MIDVRSGLLQVAQSDTNLKKLTEGNSPEGNSRRLARGQAVAARENSPKTRQLEAKRH